MLNKTVLGRYVLNEQIRESDLLIEYRGKDTQTDQAIIVTAFNPNIVSVADFLSRFEPIAKNIAKIKSPHTVALLEVGQAEGQAVLVREYVDGQSLSSLVASGNGLPLDAVLDLAQQLGEYLDVIHQSDLAQTVFNLEDILLSAKNVVRVTNLGFAQGLNISGLLSAGKIKVGSCYAPELVKGKQADVHTDFYSLGAALFEALTGKEVDVNLGAADKTLIKDLFPSQLRIGISHEWDELVSKCLHPNPAKRVQSAAEFLNRLHEIRHTTDTTAPSNILGMEDSLVGQTLGAYRLVGRLGQGGMATVYKAYEPALDRYVAIKVLPQFFANDPVFVQRFRREAKAVAQLNHPNIVPIYSYGESGGITYIAMQFVMGDTLKHERGQKFDFENALRLLLPIARALEYAHQRGIVHRDIKPSNVLLADGNWPVLADFGLALMTESSGKLTESGVGMGTPMYMSPEQGQGKKVDHRTDIYSLGIMLYELVTGDVPFRADTPMAIVIKHISAPMPMPRQINPNIPDYLETLILKATAKNPDDRYQSADEMAVAMERALERLAFTPAPLMPVATQKIVPAHQPEGSVEAKPSAVKKSLRVAMFSILGIIGACLLGVILMGVLNICPPAGPWQMPPWCTGSPIVADDTVMMLDNFESESPEGRSDWEFYFEDNTDTQLDCFVDDSGELSDSTYLQFQFDVVANSWATCGFYFDTVQDWGSGNGIAFYLRSDQPNAEYQIELFGGTPGARTTYIYWTETPPESVDDWVRIEIPWEEILRADWEENPGTVFDPAIVTGFIIGISTPEESHQSGTFWVDDLQLLAPNGLTTANATKESALFFDNFEILENFDRADLESYFLEESDTKTTCMLDDSIAYESVASLQFQFDAAPDAWASCQSSFNDVDDWSKGQGIAFYVHADQADMTYEVNLFSGALGADETYVYELVTTPESMDGWERVEIYWEDFLRANWQENSGTPLNPESIKGFSFDVSAPQQTRLNGTLWIDDFQVLP